MQKLFRSALSSVLAVLVLVPVAAHATSLAGDTFSAGYYFPSSTTVFATDPNFVADGSTHTATGNNVDTMYSITGTKLTLTFPANDARFPFSFNGEEFTDLSQSLANYSIAFDPASTDLDFALANAYISGSTIFINESGRTLLAGQTAIYDLTSNVATTPEPSSLIMLATGVLAGAGVMRRRLFA